MQHWLKITLTICSYGFFKALRPSEPFLSPYLNSTEKGFDNDVIDGQIYPYWTYAYLVLLVPVFVLTDLVRYKAMLVVETMALVVTWVLIIWGTTLIEMQAMQVVFGVASAAEVAYYAYVYPALGAAEQHRYATVTSWVRASLLFGRFVGYGLGQLLYTFHSKLGWSEYESFVYMNYISLASVSLTLIFAILLPSVKNGQKSTISTYFTKLYRTFVRSYSNPQMIKWSLWWALASCGFLQVTNYAQDVWLEIQTSQSAADHNGLTETINTFLESSLVFLLQFVHVDWSRHGEIFLCFSSIVSAALVYGQAATSSMTMCYVLYVVYCVLYQLLITIATYNVAMLLNQSTNCNASYEITLCPEDDPGGILDITQIRQKSSNPENQGESADLSQVALVFGFNTFIALVLQTILTAMVADSTTQVVTLSVTNKFFVYAAYHAFIALIYGVTAIVLLCTKSGASMEYNLQ